MQQPLCDSITQGLSFVKRNGSIVADNMTALLFGSLSTEVEADDNQVNLFNIEGSFQGKNDYRHGQENGDDRLYRQEFGEAFHECFHYVLLLK